MWHSTNSRLNNFHLRWITFRGRNFSDMYEGDIGILKLRSLPILEFLCISNADHSQVV